MATSSTRRCLGWIAPLFALAAATLTPGTCQGATFPVSTVGGFQAALTASQSNGESDTITVAAGIYLVSSTLTFSSGEARSLTIVGSGIGATILDGGSSAQVLFAEATGGGSLQVQGLTFRNGYSASSGGGALRLETTSGSLTMSACEVNDSSVAGAAGIGGGAWAVSGSGDVSVTNSFFRRNHSGANVGGLYGSSGSGRVSLSGCVFEGNTVNNTAGSEYFGDAGGAMLYTDAGGVVSVTACTFVNNTTTGGSNPDGGGLMTYQLGTGVSASVASSSFSGNQAGLGGGGLFMRMNASGTLTCDRNTFTNNASLVGDGGGALLYLDTGTITITGNRTSGNDAGAAGGGLYASLVSGSATISGNTFVGDAAGTNGGGLELFAETASSAMARNVFRSNTAAGVGAGLSYATVSGSLDLRASTFYGNQAIGDGNALHIYLDSSSAPTALYDLILWGNQPDELGFSTGSGTGSITLRYSDVQGGAGQPWYGTGCISADPLFVNASGGNLNLSWNSFPVPDGTRSQCIDSGDPGSPADPDGTRADMGALPFAQDLIFKDGFE